ncbi:virulence factor TspB C-terminal domain-related protein [Acinetobacter beijerinckii]|uniref:virulence factor TspB C-terminal domain-related protein n=1 Tax=Acinetobacter beijerinckii TaxID=262668 RepID=UPI0030094C4E
MGRYKKYLTILMIFSIHMMPFNLAYANNLGGWTINNKIAQGASLVLNASKNAIINGANIAKTSTAKITPAATNVAKILRGGAAGYALSIAVEQLLGSVDWVLDPANNQIVYKTPATQPDDPTNQYYFLYNAIKYSSLDKLCIQIFKNRGWAGQNIPPLPKGYGCSLIGNLVSPYGPYGSFGDVGAYRVANPAYDPNAQQEEKKLSLDTIAAKVISNAESETDSDKKAGAQEATTAAAEDMLANDSATQNNARSQLETNARTQTSEEAQAETKPKDPTAPEAGSDIAIKFPVFCSWAPTVCEAAQKVITFPNTLVNWWDTSTKSISESWTWAKEKYEASVTSISDFFKDEPANNELALDEPTAIEPDTTISFSTSCPAKIPLTFPWNGQTLDFSFDFTIWCDAISSFVYPIVVSLGALHALYIVAGVRNDN